MSQFFYTVGRDFRYRKRSQAVTIPGETFGVQFSGIIDARFSGDADKGKAYDVELRLKKVDGDGDERAADCRESFRSGGYCY